MSKVAGYEEQLQTPFWILVDVTTGLQPEPPLKFLELAEAKGYHLRAFDGSSRYEIRALWASNPADPVAA